MTLQQLSAVKRWHIAHHRQGSVEYLAWDLVIICWLLGWMGVPPALVLAPVAGVLACAALLMAPPAYVGLRRQLHRRGRLRCDWLGSLPRR